MSSSTSGGEPQWTGHTDTGARKANKACVPCRVRKVKCDAAVTGLPCSSCRGRQCAGECVLPVRKSRTRKVIHVLPVPSHTTGTPSTSNSGLLDCLISPDQSQPPSTSDPSDRQSARQSEPDLLYLKILNEAVKETAEPSPLPTACISNHSRLDDSLTPHYLQRTKPPHLDDVDHEYLVKKGVLDLPPPHYLDAFVKTYFAHVDPFVPVINRVHFVRAYQSGTCSLFLLRAILTSATLHAAADALSACGFASRSVAQEAFFIKAKLLHDVAAEDNLVVALQGCIILCTVILDHPTEWDFGYWFHNAIRLATKLDLRNVCIRGNKPERILKLYRKLWWALYLLDVFHVLANTSRSRLLENTSAIKVATQDDEEVEDVSGVFSGLLSGLTPQQKASPAVLCDLSLIFGECLRIVTNEPQQDPRQILQPVDAWRESLAAKMHVGGNTGTDVCYLNIQAMSYRFECVICRRIRRRWQQSRHSEWSESAKQRLRSAILELDAIAMRVLASGTFRDFPISFITTMTALLALHIESALDPTETDIVRSIAQISISQTMLLLAQGKDIPVLRRALPAFEQILRRNSLYLVPPANFGQVSPQSQGNVMTDACASPHTQFGGSMSQLEQWENNPSFDVDFLGLEFLDEWQMEQLDD